MKQIDLIVRVEFGLRHVSRSDVQRILPLYGIRSKTTHSNPLMKPSQSFEPITKILTSFL